MPLRFSVIAGEVIHQLRSSLDHLVVAMVRKRGNSVSKRHAFPVADTAKIFKSQRDGGAVEGISDTALQLIEAAQPYNIPHGERYMLSILHRKDIEDKHRLLVVVNAATIMSEVVISGPDADDGDPTPRDNTFTILLPRPLTKDGVELAKFASAHPKLDAQVKFMPHVAFEEFGSLPLQSIVPTLEQATNFIYHVIRIFDGEFV